MANGSWKIFLYVPNLIGYARVILAFAAFYYAYSDWKLFFVFYAASGLLDAFDGLAARALNQSSRLGAVLDQVTDRFVTNILYAILAHLYLDYKMVFWGLAVLDFCSHWAQMYSSVLVGNESHKKANISNPIMRLYYTSRFVLFWVCFAQEGCLLGLYAMHFTKGAWGADAKFWYTCAEYLFYVCAPVCAFKQGVNVLQLYEACESINDWDLADQKKNKKQ